MPALKKIGAAALAAFGWTSGGGATTVTASYLQVAGGGGGGYNNGGGGGAGGYLTGTTSLTTTLSYTVIVGAGGTGTALSGTQGSSSQFGTLTASVGGGYGGGNAVGGSGGSGGGGGGAGTNAGGAGTSGQGNAGAAASSRGGGGGGAGAAATTISGANGLASSISGTSTYYAGGGAGNEGGSGGLGGGGASPSGGSPAASAGTANTGGGGGAWNGGGAAAGSNGGSGIVIISYAGAQQFGGGVVTSVGGNTIHTFLTSGTLSPLSSLSASYLIVAGGGGGGNANARDGAGGGAGGLLSGSGVTIDTNSTYLVTVGAGGATDVNGTNSSFSMVSTAAVGGGKGDGASGGQVGNGGSGGGSVYFNAVAGNGGTVGTGTAGQGNAGGQGYSSGATFIVFSGGGGGGAGAVGGNASSSTSGSAGVGGVGVASSISGTSTYYAGGGGGGCQQNTTFTSSYTGGAGGNGGGGAGATSLSSGGNVNGSAGTANTGGGGGGAGAGGVGGATGGSGGSGIVIISYAGSTQQMAGGSVTIVGGNVIHTFTSSGYLSPLTYVGNSLRFRASASANLTRTPTVAGNTKTFTFSAWVKRGQIAVPMVLMGAGSGTPWNAIAFTSDGSSNRLDVSFTNGVSVGSGTVASYRDPAAWYHFVVAVDTTQSVSTDRIKVYTNGVLQTLSYTNVPAQNATTNFNSNVIQYIGRDIAGEYLDGEMTEVRMIDGQALTPNSFGTFNSYGVWQPINYGGSYGTNGFYLPFTSNNTSSYAGSFSTTNYLSLGGASQLALGSGSWTIEFWYYANAFVTNQVIYEGRPASTNGAYPTFGVTSTGALNFTTNAAVQFASADGTVSLNRWVHIAAVKNGSTTTVYYNGVALGSFSDSITYITGGSAPYICTNAFGVGTYGVNGYVSNLRVVKAAVYTSNFTVPTSPLTNITNTALLTLQSSTIVDNSSNALTITNTGSVTSPVAYPFNTKVFADQSPQGNNWTPSAVSGVAGSTYDYMTDVPTLTSTTAANYATFNPIYTTTLTANATLSNGNLTGAYNAADSMTSSTIGVTTGTWYWECYINAGSSSSWVAVSPINQTNYALFRAYRETGEYFNGSAWAAYGATYTTGDTIGIALDMTSQTITFYKNGTSQGQKTSIGLSGYTIFATCALINSGSTSINFGQQPFKYTPPSGFVALNTYNL